MAIFRGDARRWMMSYGEGNGRWLKEEGRRRDDDCVGLVLT